GYFASRVLSVPMGHIRTRIFLAGCCGAHAECRVLPETPVLPSLHMPRLSGSSIRLVIRFLAAFNDKSLQLVCMGGRAGYIAFIRKRLSLPQVWSGPHVWGNT